MKDIYIALAFLWVIGVLYTGGLRWMVGEYEKWDKKNSEDPISSLMGLVFIWPFLLGTMHAPAFIDKEWKEHNERGN